MNFTKDLQQGIHPYRQKFYDVLQFLKRYARNPIEAMRQPPEWEWPMLLWFHGTAAALLGGLSGILSLRIGQFFFGVILYPITTTFIVLIVSGFLYYTFMFGFRHQMVPKKLVTLVILANLPVMVAAMVSHYLPPAVVLLGLPAACLLLIVGLGEHTPVERQKIIRLIGGIFTVFFIFWIYNTISYSKSDKSLKELTVPGTLDILEKEMGGE